MPFLTFEGIDGSGKSTLIKKLAEHLKSLSLTIEITREPGGTKLGEELREILLRTKGSAPCPEAELLIYEADRAQHVNTKIRPLLKQNAWVLSDRFYDSSSVFQGAGRKIASKSVEWLNDFASGGLKPDLTFLLDCPVEVSQARRQSRQADRFELEKTEFHETIRNGFLELAKKHADRFLVLDATESPDRLLQLAIDELKNRGLL